MDKAALGGSDRPHDLLVVAATLVGIVLVGVIDFQTGVEYSPTALYFLPISLAAWYLGREAALASAVLCSLSWFGSNYLAGLRFSGLDVWAANVITQGVSFAVVGMLIASLRSALGREHQLSRTDPLTSLLNSRAFYQEAPRILALGRRHGHAVTLGYIDLDDFKAVNDTLGHSSGDDVLRRAADLLTGCIRAGDLCARLGGDEFVVLLSETGPDGALVILERLRALLAKTLGRGPCPVTATIGAASFIEPPVAIDELIQQADALMYAAKSTGKNRVRLEVVDRPRQIRSPAAEPRSSVGSPPTFTAG